MIKYLGFLSAIVLVSCSKPSSNPGNNYDRGPMLMNMAEKVIVPSYEIAKNSAEEFSLAVDNFNAQPSAVTLQSLEIKFWAVYQDFQLVSPYEFGPAEKLALRGNLNTYPTDSTKINSAISAGSWNFELLSFANAKGLPAVDLLLFAMPQAEVMASFTSDANASSRKLFLKDIANDIELKITTAFNEWDVDGGNYSSYFSNQTGTDVGSGTSSLVNALNRHFERFLRDGKIGIPVGVRSLGIAIPENCESYYGGISLTLALKNLDAIERMYNGNDFSNTDGLGLDDHLIGVGASDVNNRINDQIAVARTALEGLADPLSQNIIDNQSQVEAAYAELQKLIVLFKVEMPSRLGVLISYQDSDGD